MSLNNWPPMGEDESGVRASFVQVSSLSTQRPRLSAGRFPDAPRRSALVIAHQAIRMHLPLGFAASLAQREQELLAVFPDHRTIRLCNSHAMESTEAQKFLFTADVGCGTVTTRSVMKVLDIQIGRAHV